MTAIVSWLKTLFAAAPGLISPLAAKAVTVPWYVYAMVLCFCFGGCTCNHLHKAHPHLFAESPEPPLAVLDQPTPVTPPTSPMVTWQPADDGSADFGLYLDGYFRGRFVAQTGRFHFWLPDDNKFGYSFPLAKPAVCKQPARP
jgi:hypothetical protein